MPTAHRNRSVTTRSATPPNAPGGAAIARVIRPATTDRTAPASAFVTSASGFEMSDTPVLRLERVGLMTSRLQADVRTLRDEGKIRDKIMELHTERVATHEALTASRLV